MKATLPALFLLTTALCGAGLLLLHHPAPPPGNPGQTPASPAHSSPSAAWPTSTEPHPPAAPTRPEQTTAPPSPRRSDRLADSPSDHTIQQVLESSQPRDLDPGQEHALVALAWRIHRADLTGTGRSAWPGYFTGPPPVTVYTRVHFQAGIARRTATADTDITVVLIWAGTEPGGAYDMGRRTLIRLKWTGSSWQPQRRSDLTQ